MRPATIFKKAAAGLGLFAMSLFLAYNTYKEVMRSWEPLTTEVRQALKGTFPVAMLIFSACLALSVLLTRKKESRRGALLLIIFYGAAANAFFYLKGGHYISLHNIALSYFALFSYAASVVPGSLRSAERGRGLAGAMSSQHPAAMLVKRIALDLPGAFFSGFIVLMAACGALVLMQQDSAAKDLAEAAYFFLLAGIVAELYSPSGDQQR